MHSKLKDETALIYLLYKSEFDLMLQTGRELIYHPGQKKNTQDTRKPTKFGYLFQYYTTH